MASIVSTTGPNLPPEMFLVLLKILSVNDVKSVLVLVCAYDFTYEELKQFTKLKEIYSKNGIAMMSQINGKEYEWERNWNVLSFFIAEISIHLRAFDTIIREN